MEKNHYDYMLEAADLSLKNIAKRKEITKEFVEFFTAKPYKRIHMVGSGSSYNIANQARYFVQRILGMEVRVSWAYTFQKYNCSYIDDETLVIFCTQGGFSTNTVLAARALKGAGKDCIAMCKFGDTPIKDEVKALINYHFTEGDKYQTKGFIMSPLYIMLCALESSLVLKKIDTKTYDKTVEQLTKACKKLPELRALSETFYTENQEFFRLCNRIMCIGCGPNFGVALEGSLKYEETYGCHADPFELEELLHGKLCEVTKDTTIFFTDTVTSAVHERTVEVYNVLHDICDRNVIITDSESAKGKYVLRYKAEDIPEDIAVLFQIVPYQYFTYMTCADTRVEAHSRERVNCTKKLATKYPGVKF